MSIRLLIVGSAVFLSCATPSGSTSPKEVNAPAKSQAADSSADQKVSSDAAGMTVERKGPGGVKMIKEGCKGAGAGVKKQRQQVEVGITQPIDGKNNPNPPSPGTYTRFHCDEEN